MCVERDLYVGGGVEGVRPVQPRSALAASEAAYLSHGAVIVIVMIVVVVVDQ